MSSTQPTAPTAEQAQRWLDRWDRQQEYYIADREERFAVIADTVRAAAGRPDPLIVDLGSGPGSLSVRLLDAIPAARVVGIDADRLLLGLARAAYGGRERLRLVEHDLREDGWTDALGLDRAPDAFVSTTALHWLTREQLAAVYKQCGALLRDGGVLVNGDHLGAGVPGLDRLLAAVAEGRAARSGVRRGEDWRAWWDAVNAAPELAGLVGERDGGVPHRVDQPPTVHDHVAALRAAGFAEAGTVWQHGDDRVVAGVR